MSKAPSRPSRYAINRLSRETGKSLEICEAAYIEAKCIYVAALSILRAEQTPLRAIPAEEKPLTVFVPMVTTKGVQLREGMTLQEIDAVNPYPRPTGNRTIDRAYRLCGSVERGSVGKLANEIARRAAA